MGRNGRLGAKPDGQHPGALATTVKPVSTGEGSLHVDRTVLIAGDATTSVPCCKAIIPSPP